MTRRAPSIIRKNFVYRTWAQASSFPRLLVLVTILGITVGLLASQAKPAGADHVSDIATGSQHTCALTSQGTVQCWGLNSSGQLGDGSTTDSIDPVDVCADAICNGPLNNVVAISAGISHTCALMSDSGVKCWGVNGQGYLGDGTTTDRTSPVDVCDTGASAPCAPENANVLTGVASISAGGNQTCVVMTTNDTKCWGSSSHGQLGDGSSGLFTFSSTPVNVCSDATCTSTLASSQVSAGTQHTCAVTTGGGVKCWGNNNDGRLGDGTETNRSTPVNVCADAACLSSLTGTRIAAASFHSCADNASGNVKCWGLAGRLGDGTTSTSFTPVDVCADATCEGLLADVNGLSATSSHTCALMNGGGAKCWGQNGSGRLGDGTTTDRTTPVDVCAPDAAAPCEPANGNVLSNATMVSTGGVHTCALTTDSAVLCWGLNSSGQLGDGTTNDSSIPVEALGLHEQATPTPTATPTQTPTPTVAPTNTPTPTATPEPLLAKPTDLVAQALSMSAISLEWTDNSSGEDGYEVQRDAGAGFVRVALLPPDAISHLDEELEPDTTYVYRVRAFIGTTQFSEFSDPAAATTFGGPTLALPWVIVNSVEDHNLRDGLVTLREAMMLTAGTLDVADLDADECGQLLNTTFNGVCSFTMFGEVSSIGFDPAVFPPDSPVSILPFGPLPDVYGAIDGALGAFVAGVIVDGGFGTFDCFTINSDGNTIADIQIIGCENGVHITSNDNALTGLQITASERNGVYVNGGADNLIGGTTASDRNVISGNSTGIRIQGPGASGNDVYGNYIGTDAAGTSALPNLTGVGISEADSNHIGGAGAGEGNVISGNEGSGIRMSSGATANLVRGNLIGPDATGMAPLPNGSAGVTISHSALNLVGGTMNGSGNVISGNQGAGIEIFNSDSKANLIQGNLIGTDSAGTSAMANSQAGIDIGNFAGNTGIGGTTAGARNVISGNGGAGISMSFGSHIIQGNYIGTDATGMSALPNAGNGVQWSGGGSDETVLGGSAPGAGNVISGNGGAGVRLEASRNTIQGNFIGTNAAGDAPLANSGDGIEIDAAGNNIIGGTTEDAGNVISGNLGRGITIADGDNNTIQGNFIGTDATGSTALANSSNGIRISDSSGNVIGGADAEAGNVVSANGDHGIRLGGSSSGNTIQGNRIGVDESGTTALANSGSGIFVLAGDGNIIGGPAMSAGNVISGNTGTGIDVRSADNVIQGNLVGTDATGLAALGNGNAGVAVLGGENNLLGGADPAAGNVISGNDSDGVRILTGGTTVQHNQIGTDAPGTSALPNGAAGVFVGGSSTTDTQVLRNTIAFNDAEGVFVDSNTGTGNTIQFNAIHSNGGLGIRVDQAGIPIPSLQGALTKSLSDPLLVNGLLSTSTPQGTRFIVDFYTNSSCDPSGFGEGEEHLESLLLFADVDGNITWPLFTAPVAPGSFITATATDAAGGTTSEFSECVEVVQPPTVAASDLDVRCLQDPILPRAGETFTVTAEAVDDNLNPIVLADNVEIYIDDRNSPVASGVSADGVREVSDGPLTSGQILHYGCRVENDDGDVFTGWRKVVVDDSPVTFARPIFMTDAYRKSIDIVFIADTDYGAVSPLESAAFLEDVEEAIHDGYFGEGIFLQNQSQFNFWLAILPGDAFRDDDDKCVLSPPVGWSDFLGFADVGAILHTDKFRDCARSSHRLFSAETTDGSYPRVLLHETGHAPFGLADEYCCDGGYFEQGLFPNVYKSEQSCKDDATDVGRTGTDCRDWDRDKDGKTFWTSDPASGDLMAKGSIPRALDIRRIEWLFGQCDVGLC